MDDLEQLLSDLESVNYHKTNATKMKLNESECVSSPSPSSSSSSSVSFNSTHANNKNNQLIYRNSNDFIESINQIVSKSAGNPSRPFDNEYSNRKSAQSTSDNYNKYDKKNVEYKTFSNQPGSLCYAEDEHDYSNLSTSGDEKPALKREESNSSISSTNRIADLAELDSLLDELYTARKHFVNQNQINRPITQSSYASNDDQATLSVSSSLSISNTSSPNSNSLKSHTNSNSSLGNFSQNSNSNNQVQQPQQSLNKPGLDQSDRNKNKINQTNKVQAARELENLMASLSMYKNDGVNVPSSESINDSVEIAIEQDRQKPNLDVLKNKLISKNLCYSCQEPINGQVITALGHMWHPSHFVCFHCGKSIGTSIFYEKDHKPYCENDYLNLFSPKCAACHEPILDKMLTALNDSWHIDCFVCCSCSKTLNDESFLEINNSAYCKECYVNELAPKCKRCNHAIVENFISALDAYFHPGCFVCVECGSPFNATSFYEYQNMPYCEIHYHMKRGSLCNNCQQPINGRCITAMNKKYHPEHFNCSFCLKQLNKGTFKEQNDKPYCHPCFFKLFP